MDGFLLIDKPRGITSRRAIPRGAGHTGTLDPRATGLLIALLGRATKLAPYLEGLDKEYVTTIRLGVLTTTDDLDGDAIEERPVDRDAVEARLAGFAGTFEQRPPAVSAVRVRGERAYKRVRRGERVEPAPRAVTIHAIEQLGWDPLRLRIVCSAGTYVRAIARDLGGAVDELRRTRIGSFRVEEAGPTVRPVEEVVAFLPSVTLADARDFADGKPGAADAAGLVRVFGPDGFVGVGRGEGGVLRADRVLYR